MIQAKRIDDDDLHLGGVHANAALEIAEGGLR
ncbi:MAG: hypothetical protein JWP97_1793 [Labilithrix sp.]|nr:hypothetical protein [Labilithrix sp.]